MLRPALRVRLASLERSWPFRDSVLFQRDHANHDWLRRRLSHWLPKHNCGVESVFNLLGEKENDITFSLGWALSRSSLFLQRFLKRTLNASRKYNEGELTVALQEFQRESGITDIEIRGPQLHMIVEAK